MPLIIHCADIGSVSRGNFGWARLAIGRAGVDTKETTTSAPVTLDEGDIDLPDILTDLQDKTSLTRRSIHRILVECGRLDDFKRNPQQFIELAAEIINPAKRMALVDGIKYQRIGDEEGAKIKCGRAHFKALAIKENPAKYIVARKVDDLMAHC